MRSARCDDLIFVRSGSCTGTTSGEVAIEIYLQLADDLVGARGWEHYRDAATMLGRARNLFDRLDRFEEWEEHIARLRSEHRRLPAFLDELNRAEL